MQTLESSDNQRLCGSLQKSGLVLINQIMSERVIRNNESIPLATRQKISERYKRITRAINKTFWNSESDTTHSLYVGSYGRGTAIDTSDIDILIELPKTEYERYDAYKGNGQSRLLQAVKDAVLSTYPNTYVKPDGQVIKVHFSDRMKFELLPAFPNTDYLGNPTGTYTYADTNNGGNWKATNPKAEQKIMRELNDNSNGLLFDTCKHIRRIRGEHFSSYHLSGIVIDAFVCAAIDSWKWCVEGDGTTPAEPLQYENNLLCKLQTMRLYYLDTLRSPGSGQILEWSDSVDCLEKVLKYITKE